MLTTGYDVSRLKKMYLLRDTFNIDAVLKGSSSRTFVDRSNDFGSVDISSNFGKDFGLKAYSSGEASAGAQSVSIFQRFKEYQAHGGKDGIDKFLNDRGYDQIRFYLILYTQVR